MAFKTQKEKFAFKIGFKCGKESKSNTSKNFKSDILHSCDFKIDLLQVPEIENFIYDNKNKKYAVVNRDLKNRWRLRRKKTT